MTCNRTDHAATDLMLRGHPPIDRAQTIEVVTVAFLRWLERHRSVMLADVAAEVAGGNRPWMSRFVSRETPNLSLAQRIINVHPEIGAEIGEPIVCSRCGRLPHPPRSRRCVHI